MAEFMPYIIGIVIAVLIIQSMQFHCPNCRKVIDREANICPYCLTEFVDDDEELEEENA